MAARSKDKDREGLSFETLVIASLASATAAIVTSQFWQGGTPIAAAVTPVIVALVSEGLRRPMQSDLVRRPARRAAELGAAPVRRRTAEQPVLTPPAQEPDPRERPTRPLMPTTNGEGPHDEPAYSVYRADDGPRPTWRDRLSRHRVRIAVVTGLIAFVIAGLVVTVPELIFGGSVTGTDRNTTFFGGGGTDRDRDEDGGGREEGRDTDAGGTETPSPDRPSGSAPTPDDDQDAPTDEPPSEEPPPQNEQPAPAPIPQPPPEVPNQP